MDSIQWGEWHKHTDQLFYPGRINDFGMADPTDSVQRFLRHIKGLADAVHAKRGLDPANYEDLFFLVQQIADQERGEQRNAAVDAFGAALRLDVHAFPVNQGHSDGYPSVLTALAAMAGNLIQSVVRHKLATANAPVGLDLIRDVTAREPVTIVTLNHDLLVERVLRDAGIPFDDGFGIPDGEIRWFHEQNLTPRGAPRLLKLHGSINWYRMAMKAGANREPKVVIPLNGDPWHCKTANGEALDNWSGDPLFLTGVGNKAASYNLGIYAEMFFRFHEALKANRIIVMSGYGWGDRGVNTRLMDWLFDAADRRLVLLHEKPEEFLLRLTPLTHRRDWLVQQGRLIEVKKWLKDVTLADLNALLAGL
jgi:hypothetical protein